MDTNIKANKFGCLGKPVAQHEEACESLGCFSVPPSPGGRKPSILWEVEGKMGVHSLNQCLLLTPRTPILPGTEGERLFAICILSLSCLCSISGFGHFPGG